MNKTTKSVKILKDNEININQWQHLVEESDKASFFQTKACFDFYNSLSFLEPFVYAVYENNSLVGLASGYLMAEKGWLKSYFSRRAIILGGALLAKDISNEALQLLLQKLKTELQDKSIYIEFRNFHDYSTYKNVFEKVGFAYQPHLNFQIDLSSKQKVLAKLSETKKRQIRQTLKAGVHCELTQRTEDIADFYQILKILYQKKIKLPLFPLEFFEKIAQLPFGHLIVVKSENNVIGGILVVGNENTLYEWFVCGAEPNTPNIYPSVLATWAGIKQGIDNNCILFDFMGAGKPEKSYGVRDFKARFGGKLVENGRFLYICKPLLYKIGKIAIQMRKIL